MLSKPNHNLNGRHTDKKPDSLLYTFQKENKPLRTVKQQKRQKKKKI